jgi:RimJ/RimL family protein N-acetyltransferase
VHEAALESVAEVSPYETWCHEGYTLDEAAEYADWWDRAWDRGSAYYFAATDEATGRYLGSCGLCPIEREHATAGLGFWVRTSETGRGAATAAARLVADAGFEHLGLNRIELLIAVQNTASRRVAEKLGAVCEGTLRKRLVLPAGPTDMAMYALVR